MSATISATIQLRSRDVILEPHDLLSSRDIRKEKIGLGDETGVQGRFNQSISQAVGAVLEAQSIEVLLEDFKASGVHRLPDSD
ncbi:hypothetical protein N7495_007108 [Penicillium taxi]|uniref:uncharacterized protein n=1 Tax=Penicillium taxi TaxID=168475 RepID=UPI002545B89A|nr:uncharacterized protein N7495_007108 [Penicillium taxi]KAJ5895417.1 hypothetical protein N7495_007108 [Penicillium taxi]